MWIHAIISNTLGCDTPLSTHVDVIHAIISNTLWFDTPLSMHVDVDTCNNK